MADGESPAKKVKTGDGSYYKIIDGNKYDRELFDTVEKFAADGQVGYPEAKQLWKDAEDGRGVTDIEKATLELYNQKLQDFFKITDDEKHQRFKVAVLKNEEDCQDFEINCAYCLGLVFDSKECDECNTPYCSICIELCREKNGGQWNCPKNCSSQKYKKLNRYLQAQINKLTVTCTMCNKDMSMGDLAKEEHFKACIDKSMKCPLQCPKLIRSQQEGLEHWANDCPEALTLCEFCEEHIQKRAKMENHHKLCDQFPVKCPNQGCNQKFKRIEEREHLAMCDYSNVTCGLCNATFLRKNFQKHQDECLEAMIPCP